MDREHLYLDEIEAKASCKKRSCNGRMPLSMVGLKELKIVSRRVV